MGVFSKLLATLFLALNCTILNAGIQTDNAIPDQLCITNDTDNCMIIDNISYNPGDIVAIFTDETGLVKICNQANEVIATIEYPVYVHGDSIAEVFIIWTYSLTELLQQEAEGNLAIA